MKRTILIATLGALFAPLSNPYAGDTSGKLIIDDAAPVADSLWTRDTLTGDWGGLRTDLSDSGVDLQFRLSQYYQGVASGGVNENSEYGGTVDYRVHLDGDKLFGAKGFSVDMHARTRYGQDISADAGAFVLQNVGMLMPAPGGYNGTDITGLTVSQYLPLPNDGLGLVMAGKLDVIDLVTMFFPNVGYGQEGFQNVNAMVTALPWFGAVRGLSLYGGLGVTINEKYQIPQSGLLITGTENESTSWGSLSDSYDDGLWIAGFHRFIWDVDDKMGYFMVFAGGSTRQQASNDPNSIVIIPGQGLVDNTRKKPWDVAMYLYQDFWQDSNNSNRKANFMIGGTVGPDDPQFAEWNIFGNVEMFGLFGSRPYDRVGVCAWYNGLSSNFKQLTAPVVNLQDTWGAELYYNFQITPWSHLTADIQFVENQRASDDFAIIPGVRMTIDF